MTTRDEEAPQDKKKKKLQNRCFKPLVVDIFGVKILKSYPSDADRFSFNLTPFQEDLHSEAAASPCVF